MTLGFPTGAFLQVHVLLSLFGIAAGIVMCAGLATGRALGAATAFFFLATAMTSLTGFALPPLGFDPPRAIGLLSLAVLAIALFAFFGGRLAGAWRWIYVVSALAGFYLNVFVAIVQGFQKLPALHALAPTQTEPPFLVAQLAALAIFLAVGWLSVKRFRPA